MWTRWPRRKGRIGCSRAPSCSPGETRCLIRLSRGGGDAVVMREYDLKAKKLATDGFSLPEAKGDATIWMTTRCCSPPRRGRQPSPAMPASCKLWKRGTPVAARQDLYEGRPRMCWSAPAVFHTKDGDIGLVMRAVTFFRNRIFRWSGNGRVEEAAIAAVRRSARRMIERAHLIVHLARGLDAGRRGFQQRARWWPVLSEGRDAAGDLCAGPARSVESVGVGARQGLCRHHRQCDRRGACASPRRCATAGRTRCWRCRAGGAADIVSANDFGPRSDVQLRELSHPAHAVFR